jgi:CubicO group peptidase (beta-lactamase class C family)
MADAWTTARTSLRPHFDFTGDPDREYPLDERMHVHNVSAVSIAIVHDGQLAVDEGIGQLAADDPTPANTNTLFATCSISKAVSAVAALRLVAAGKLPLDGDVNEHMRDWRLRDAQNQVVKVTLRQILTHTAGINIHGADGYDPRGPLPTLEQVFRGETPCVSAAVRVTREPGAGYEYSSGGFIVIQKLICDTSGQSFDDAMESLVFRPLSMRHSTFRSNAAGMPRAAAHVSLIRRASPESALVWPARAPAGLWSTAGDLARLMQVLQSAFDGNSDFLPQALAREVLRKQTPHHDIGLGLYLLGEGPSRRFSHMGGYLGYGGEMLGWLEGGYGVALLINNGYTARALKTEIMQAVIKAYGWPS